MREFIFSRVFKKTIQYSLILRLQRITWLTAKEKNDTKKYVHIFYD